MRLSERLGSGPGRIVAVAIAAAVVAELAVLVLSPAPPELDPVGVEATEYFAADQIERARDFRGGQRNLFLLGLAIELGVLAALACGRPRRFRALLDCAGARPLLGAAAVGAGISLLLTVLVLPIGLIAHDRAVDVGLATQETGEWLTDRAKGAGIGMLIAAVGAFALVGLQRRLPRLWWLAGAAVVVSYAIVSSWLAPVVLAPAFNDFEPLPEGPTRTTVLALSDRAGVDVGEVYSVDASRRSTALNAYVDGLGSSKRVVIYDNLLERSGDGVLEAVVAHELGHVAGNDIPRGLLFVALVAPLGMLTVALAGSALAGRVDASAGNPAAVPAFALALTLVAFGLGLAGSQLSRLVEASADAFSLELTDDPDGLIELQRRLATANLSDPDPSSPIDAIMRTHPPTVERIGAALAYRRPPG